MTVELVAVQKENEQLKNQAKTLSANIAAVNQTLSETIQTSINLRTNNVLFQQMIQECNQKIGELTARVANLEKDIAAKQDEITKLLAPAPIPATQLDGEAAPSELGADTAAA